MASSSRPNNSTGHFVSTLIAIVFGVVATVVEVITLSAPVEQQVIVLTVTLSVIALIAIYIYTHTPLSVSQKVGAWMMICGIIVLSALIIIEIPLIVSPTYPGNTSGIIPPSTPWRPILKQTAPNCNNPPGAEWYVHKGGTDYTCNSSRGVMEQTTSNYYVEVDLLKVKGSVYNQTNFRVLVDIAFQNPNDPSTWAALTVQSPANPSIPGGYIFTLSPSGACTLQRVDTSQSIPTVGQKSVNIDPHQVVHMMVIVHNDVLYAYVNDNLVLTQTDTLSTSPNVVGLMVERQNAAPSALVQFSNFELDEA